MDADVFLAIFGGRLDFFISKYRSEADCDNLVFAADCSDFGAFYTDCECGNGGVDDFAASWGDDEFLGCNWQLYLDFFY